jgi:H+-translocating NAD(P) transhydrogenase subunit alpha
MDFISILSIFVMACFVDYYVVWSVTPALHTPLMMVTNATWPDVQNNDIF